MTVDKCFSTENFTNKVSRACLSYVHIFTLNINLHQQPFLSLMFASELCLSSCFHYARSCFSYKTCVQLVYTLRCTLPVCDLTLQCCWYPRTKLNNTQGLNGKLTINKLQSRKITVVFHLTLTCGILYTGIQIFQTPLAFSLNSTYKPKLGLLD